MLVTRKRDAINRFIGSGFVTGISQHIHGPAHWSFVVNLAPLPMLFLKLKDEGWRSIGPPDARSNIQFDS